MGHSSKPKPQTVGYKYYINLHLAICHGTLDAIREIWFADKVAWSGDLRFKNTVDGVVKKTEEETRLVIRQEKLFGGTDSEGGVSGTVGVGFGSQEQQMLGVAADGSYTDSARRDIKTSYGSSNVFNYQDIAAGALALPPMAVNYRGLAVANFYSFYIGTSPYLKDMSFKVERYWDDWYPEKARIGDDANPAHIIYEALTNTDWGLGYRTATIDEAAFRQVADTLYSERLGLSLIWDAEQELIDFIESIKTCIDAAFFLNRRTGLWTLRLIREGQTSVMTVNPANAVLETLTRRALADTVNEMSVKYTNPETEEFATLTVQDLANVQSQGRAVQQTKEYLGVRVAGTAAYLAQRDLQSASATLATAEVTVNRQAWHVNPGDVVTLNWPDEGIVNMTMRAIDTTQAEPGSDAIKMTLVEDVFGQAGARFTDAPTPGYTRPDVTPELFDPALTWEFPYWFINGFFSGTTYPEGTAFSTVLAATDMTSAWQQELYSWESQLDGTHAWEQVASGSITPTAVTTKAMPANATSVVDAEGFTRIQNVDQTGFVLLTDGVAGGHEEICQIASVNMEAQQITLTRGLLDTPPRAWPAGTEMLFIGTTNIVADSTVRARGQIVQYRPVMQTSQSAMALGDVPTQSLTLRGRYSTPYPVGNVTIDKRWWPASAEVGATLKVNFSTRNRLMQDATVQVKWGDANIAPETGTSFGYELYDAADNLLSSEREVYQYSLDVNVSPIANLGPTEVRLVIFSERNGQRNYQDFEHRMTITSTAESKGYGMGYGQSYGTI